MNAKEELSGKLKESGRKLPFTVPRHYFDDFPARMQARLEEKMITPATKRVRFYDYVRPALSLAAAFASVFLLVYWPVRVITKSGLTAKNQANTESEKIISLVEHVDDQTFFSLLENGLKSEPIEDEIIETYIAENYSDFDIFMEIQK